MLERREAKEGRRERRGSRGERNKDIAQRKRGERGVGGGWVIALRFKNSWARKLNEHTKQQLYTHNNFVRLLETLLHSVLLSSSSSLCFSWGFAALSLFCTKVAKSNSAE